MRWRLTSGGPVRNLLTLTDDQLRALPSVEEYATLACISNSVGGDAIGNAHSDGFPLRLGVVPGTVLGCGAMNGEPLPARHGSPVRAADGTGRLQPAARTPSRPDGAAGYHRVSVRVG